MGYHVAIFSPDLNLGGAQRVTVNLANGLSNRGYDVDFIMPIKQGELFDDISETVEMVFLRKDFWPVIGSISCVPDYKRYLEREKPDVILSQRTHGNVISILATKVAKHQFPIAVTEHTWYDRADNLKDKITLSLANILYNQSDAVVCVSEGVARSVISTARVSENKLWKIPNPLEIKSIVEQSLEPLDHPWFKDDELQVILAAGRLEPVKNFSLLVEAFRNIHQNNQQARLVILGDGNEQEHLQSQLEMYGLENVAELPGHVNNPYKYMRNADVFVLTSIYEGFGNVLIEAMASGCPVVSTNNSSGPVEILDEGKYGTLVKSDPTQICKEIENTLASPVNQEMLLERAYDFTPEVILNDYEHLIQTLIQDNVNKINNSTSTVSRVRR